MTEPGLIAQRVTVWDVPVRLFHWLLVGLIGFSWWSGEQHEMDWHRTSGYAILALLVFRLYWGFAGSGTARFAGFLRGPRAVATYAAGLLRRQDAGVPGHNPLGGWSVLLLLATLFAMVGCGLFAVDVDGLESGPLSDYVSFEAGRTAAEVHGLLFNLLLGLIALHLAAILFHALVLRHNLVGPMVHGRAPLPSGATWQSGRVGWWRVLPGLLLAGGIAYAVSRGFRF